MNKEAASELMGDIQTQIESELRQVLSEYSKEVQKRLESEMYGLSQKIANLSLKAMAGKAIHNDVLHLKAHIMNIGAKESMRMEKVSYEVLINFFVQIFTRILMSIIVQHTS